MGRWTRTEKILFSKNYDGASDKELAKKFNRSIKAVSYMATCLGLKKDPLFYSKMRKKTNIKRRIKEDSVSY